MALRAVFFDLGDTLFDPVPDVAADAAALQDVADAYGLGVSGRELLDAWNRVLAPVYLGQPDKWIPIQVHLNERFTETLRSSGRRATAQDIAWFEDAYLERHAKADLLFPDVRAGLERIGKLGLHLGVLSDTDEVWAKYVLKAQGIFAAFASMTTSERVGVGKPNAGIFRAALATAGARPAEAAMVGDSATRDIEGAKGVGMVAIHMDRHGHPAAAADHVVRDMAELAELLARLAGPRR